MIALRAKAEDDQLAGDAPTQDDTPKPQDEIGQGPNSRRVRSPAPLLSGVEWGVWLGIAVATVGFALLAVAWGQVAGETRVEDQLPYVASAGIFGVVLVVAGLAVLDMVTRRSDATALESRVEQLAAILDDVRRALEEADD